MKAGRRWRRQRFHELVVARGRSPSRRCAFFLTQRLRERAQLGCDAMVEGIGRPANRVIGENDDASPIAPASSASRTGLQYAEFPAFGSTRWSFVAITAADSRVAASAATLHKADAPPVARGSRRRFEFRGCGEQRVEIHASTTDRFFSIVSRWEATGAMPKPQFHDRVVTPRAGEGIGCGPR